MKALKLPIILIFFLFSSLYSFDIQNQDKILFVDHTRGNLILELKAHNLNGKGYFFIGKLENKIHTISEFAIFGYIKKETPNVISITFTHQIRGGTDEPLLQKKEYFESNSNSNKSIKYYSINYKNRKIIKDDYLVKINSK